MDTEVPSTGVRYSNSPESYVRLESDRPRLSEVSPCDDVPVSDMSFERTQVFKQQIAEACESYDLNQVTNHGVHLKAVKAMLEVATESFSLPVGMVVEEMLKTTSGQPIPLDKHVPEWPTNSADFNQGSSEANAGKKFSASDYKSSLDGKDLEKIWKRFDKKEEIVLRLPDDGERPYSYNKGDVVLYVAYLKTGMTLPFQPIIVKVLDRLGLAPSQLAPNAWRIVISCSELWQDCFSDEISVDEFLYCYKLAKLPKSSGQWHFVARDTNTKLLTDLPKSNGSWTREYFLVRGEDFCESVKRLWSDPNDSARECPKLDKIHLDRIQKARVFKEGVSCHYPKRAGRRREEQSKEMNTNIQSQKKAKLPTFSQRKRKASAEMSSQETSAHRVTPPVVPNPEVQVSASTSSFVEDVQPLTVVEPPRPSKGKEVAILPTTPTDAAIEMVRSKQVFMEQHVTEMLTTIVSHVVVGLQKVVADIAVRDNLSEMENKELERELTIKDVVMEKDEHLEAAEE